ncbi:MAG: molecular chaperone HtpG [Flavobacteriales bacterium]|jgi:molecular chaperone HtpG|nr:molecular chaperone HtpG [Flavobacteriales bacterium]
MSTTKINVTTENLFPIIKKFLYSDHDIFIREIVSNAVDACSKLHFLSGKGQNVGEIGNLQVELIVDKEAKTITVKDNGIGMTKEEVEKYINEVAFSGAKDFMNKYEEESENSGIIGHFGLGFYSSFMISDKVEIFTKSFQDAPAVHWSCEGTPEIVMEDHDKTERGTEIVMHVAEDSVEFLEDHRINELLSKYCKFLPIPIKFGTQTRTEGEGEDAKEITEDNFINNPTPAWVKSPSSLEDKDYKDFYRELYPMQFEEPLFHIHLNVDYPFNLTGILYFPKVKQNMDLQKNKIQLYSRQVFVTDSVEGIVPDFLTFLHGVIDSPDIPLNVSRSYLQADGNVKKISSHITKKVADKLDELFRKDREGFEAKWNDIKMIVEYGMLTEEKFYKKAQKFFLFETTEGSYMTLEELKEKVKTNQTDKDDNLVILYTNDKTAQHSYIAQAKERAYEVVVLDSPIASHFIQKIETEGEKIKFARVDADTMDKLIPKTEEIPSLLSKEQEDQLKEVVTGVVSDTTYVVQIESLDSQSTPFMLTQTEQMRRMKEMQQTGGGMMMFGEMPDSYNLVINANHELSARILNEEDETQKIALIQKAYNLAKLSKNLLSGEELHAFVKQSFRNI